MRPRWRRATGVLGRIREARAFASLALVLLLAACSGGAALDEPSALPGAGTAAADGVEVAAAPPSFPPRRRPPRPDSRRGDGEELGHTTMETCVADLDRLLSSPRPLTGDDGRAADRAALVEAERAKLAERLRLRTEAAKALRETRTGEISPVTAPLAEDGAGDL